MSRLVLGILALSACTPPPDVCAGRSTVVDFKTDGSIGGRWNAATQTLAYGRPAADGHYRVFTSDAKGDNEQRLTSSAWPEGRHQFPVVWHPSGKYVFVEVEKSAHMGSSNDAIPGYGAYTDLWLIRADGTEAWKLVDEPDDFDHAITHGAITPDGLTFAWTERVKAPQVFDANLAAGSYVFHVADFVDGATPTLANIRTVKPGDVDQGAELDGISADGSTLAFYSTLASKNLFSSRIYTLNLATNSLHELTTDSFSQAPQFTADGQHLIYMSGSGADIFPGDIQGADWWSVSLDGTHHTRLTCMNLRDATQSVNHYRLAGVFSFDSDTSFFGDVMTQPLGLVGKIVKVTFPSE